jgi:hypothetical protein
MTDVSSPVVQLRLTTGCLRQQAATFSGFGPALVVKLVVSVQTGDKKGNKKAGEIKAPKWRNGRRAGLKIRSTQVGVGSSPTFGSNDLGQIEEMVFEYYPP